MRRNKIEPTIIIPEAYYDEKSTAIILGKSPRSLARWRLQGTGCRYSRNGKSCLYKGADLIQLLERSTFGSTSEEDRARRTA